MCLYKTQRQAEADTVLECVLCKVRISGHAKWGRTAIIIIESSIVAINLPRMQTQPPPTQVNLPDAKQGYELGTSTKAQRKINRKTTR